MAKLGIWSLLGVVLLLVLAGAGCENTETLAPEDSTITLTATPAQIVLGNGIQQGDVTLLATVRNVMGVSLEGQDVRFTTSSGILIPQAGTPVTTDSIGNAVCTLTGATQGPTITATSGTATATLTLTAATGLLSTIILKPSPILLQTCSDEPTLTATALDPSGDPIEGVTIEFVFVDQASTDILGSFPDSPGVSDVNGEVTTTLVLDSGDCQTKCGSGKTCTGSIQARNIGGTVQSNKATISDGI